MYHKVAHCLITGSQSTAAAATARGAQASRGRATEHGADFPQGQIMITNNRHFRAKFKCYLAEEMETSVFSSLIHRSNSLTMFGRMLPSSDRHSQ